VGGFNVETISPPRNEPGAAAVTSDELQIPERAGHSLAPCRRVVNNITRTEPIQFDLAIGDAFV
jgi:hypothetical protein